MAQAYEEATSLNLESCLASPVQCHLLVEQALPKVEKLSREWYGLMYLDISARWYTDNLSMPVEEIAYYVTLDKAPEVFRVTVDTIYAKLLLSRKETAEGCVYAERAIQLIKQMSTFAPDPRRLAELINLQNYLGQHKKANASAQWAMAVTGNINNEDAKASLLTAVGHAAWYVKDFKRAQEYFLKVLRAYQSTHRYFDLATGYTNLGRVYQETDNVEAAKENFTHALEMFNQIPGETLKDAFYVQLRLAELDCMQQHRQQVEERLSKIKRNALHLHHRPLYDELKACKV